MLLLGHRGARASRQFPENTLESFELCLAHGCDGFEFDVRCSADGVPVICHDPAIAGREIAASPFEDLLLPTLEGVLQQFSARAFLDVELKVTGLENQLIAALRAHPPLKGYVVSSFLPDVLKTVHEIDSTVPLGFLYEEQEKAWLSLPLAYLVPHFTLVNRELVEEAHALGRKMMTWTVNHADDMRRFSDWGVDAIISDDTELLIRSLR